MTLVGKSDGNNYNIIPKTMGVEMVCLRGVLEDTTQKFGDFIVPDTVSANDRALYYEVVKVGSDVEEISGVRVGDFVFVDALARFADTFPISFINCRNIIIKTDLAGKSVIPLKYKVLAKIVEPTQELDNTSGFLKISNIDPYGEIVAIGDGCDERGYKVGDRVSVSSNADTLMFGNTKYFIYDWRVPMFKFVDKKEQSNV